MFPDCWSTVSVGKLLVRKLEVGSVEGSGTMLAATVGVVKLTPPLVDLTILMVFVAASNQAT